MTQISQDVQNAVVQYRVPGPTAQAFHESNKFVRVLRGPLGSGKTTSAIQELLNIAVHQEPSPDGIRRTRFLCIRSTFPELKSTVIESFKEWIPTSIGKWNNQSPISFRIQDGNLDIEWWFLALDNEADIKKVLSLEVTCAWFSEIGANGGMPKPIFDAVTGRVGRYPSKGGSKGCPNGATFYGIIAETNSGYTVDDWLGVIETSPPDSWGFYVQPGGLEEGAENKQHLPDQYYERLCEGKDKDWVDVYVHNKHGRVMYGKVVYPSFRYRTHVTEEAEPKLGVPVLAGFDPGLGGTAIVLGQLYEDGRWCIFDEFVTEELGVQTFGENFRLWFQRTWPGYRIEGFTDPAATQRSQLDESVTALKIINATTGFVWKAAPVPNNALSIRLEAVRNCLNKMVNGEPGITVNPRCKTLIQGFSTGYFYKQIRSASSGTETYQEKPEKNKYSHCHDALQYLICGGREHRIALGAPRTVPMLDINNRLDRIDLTEYQPDW